MKKLEQIDGLAKVNGEKVMSEKAVRLQPLKNFGAFREKAKTEEQERYRRENGIIKDIEKQVCSKPFASPGVAISITATDYEFRQTILCENTRDPGPRSFGISSDIKLKLYQFISCNTSSVKR